MHRLIRFYNQNRKDIWKIIGVIIIIIVILQLLNYAAKRDNRKQQQSATNDITTSTTTKYNNLNLETEKSVLSGKDMSPTQEDSLDVINNFFRYCNEQKLQEAYELLTEECKDEMYSSLQIFDEMYYQKVINGQKKEVSVENWTDNIFKVKINENFLSSGKYSTENTIQDYITAKKDDNDEYKLNINGYIGRENIDKERVEKNVNIKVIQKDEYMNYTKYTFEITNDSDKAILLDSLENINTMYIQDSKKIKYEAYTHELSQGQLMFNQGEKKQIKIKYYNKYQSDKKIKNVVFSKIILDYQKYSDYYSFEIDL